MLDNSLVDNPQLFMCLVIVLAFYMYVRYQKWHTVMNIYLLNVKDASFESFYKLNEF